MYEKGTNYCLLIYANAIFMKLPLYFIRKYIRHRSQSVNTEAILTEDSGLQSQVQPDGSSFGMFLLIVNTPISLKLHMHVRKYLRQQCIINQCYYSAMNAGVPFKLKA